MVMVLNILGLDSQRTIWVLVFYARGPEGIYGLKERLELGCLTLKGLKE